MQNVQKCSNKIFKCKICSISFEDSIYNKFHICDKCKDNLQGDLDGFTMNHRNCNAYYKTKHNFKACPICREVLFVLKCEKYHSVFHSRHSSNKICKICKENSLKSESVKLSKKEELKIELDLALKTGAKYWNLAPGYQMKIFKERMS